MGNTFFCNRCDIDKFQLSKACADQFLNDGNESQTSVEDRWREKIKCLDDAHSRQHGITAENFDLLLEKLQTELNTDKANVYCRNRDLVLECLRRNPHCMLNCQREMDEFIDCVDTVRIRKMKQRIYESMKQNRADLNTLFD